MRTNKKNYYGNGSKIKLRYATRKLSIGMVSIMMGMSIFFGVGKSLTNSSFVSFADENKKQVSTDSRDYEKFIIKDNHYKDANYSYPKTGLIIKYDNDVEAKRIDSDGDHINDYLEVKIFHTDPTNAEDLRQDTDGDGIPDLLEVMYFYTNPNNVDSDGDGLTDGTLELDGYDGHELESLSPEESSEYGVGVKK